MKILLDENLPVKLKNYFSDTHIVTTVRDEKWSGIKNGTLLKLLQQNDFDAFITIDKNIKDQHNLNKTNILLIILDAYDNKLPTLIPFIKILETKISNLKDENCITVNI